MEDNEVMDQLEAIGRSQRIERGERISMPVREGMQPKFVDENGMDDMAGAAKESEPPKNEFEDLLEGSFEEGIV